MAVSNGLCVRCMEQCEDQRNGIAECTSFKPDPNYKTVEQLKQELAAVTEERDRLRAALEAKPKRGRPRKEQ